MGVLPVGLPHGEYAVRMTSNWKCALTLQCSRLNQMSMSMSTLWWEDPLDPVHVLDWCCDAMAQSGKMNGCVATW
ncbi:hypothetical protein BGW80DRAFT_1314741 [Lactifluus volemus]|nr:hypothetical protein BGW80DRAFT_1314741 [Lactifluus volemus]